MTTPTPAFLQPTDGFVHRHIGPREEELAEMLALLGKRSLGELVDATVPAAIRLRRPLQVGAPRGEHELLRELRAIAGENQVWRSYLGLGYHGTITPPVIQRNVLENPGWYTQYTPYQPEISQGRLEALINFQTLVADLTGLPLSNASLLDEGTAAAEAMHMCWQACDGKRRRFFVGSHCHPQTIAVVKTRAEPHGIEVVVGNPCELDPAREPELFGVLLQYPGTCGGSQDWSELIARVHAAGAQVVMATDLLALCLMKPPGEMGADIAIGSSQRFGVPMGFGGPHAAFMSAKDEHKRRIPGRIVGQSRDGQGRVAYRLALATREQHIRREKATSNICTAQVLLAVIAGMYAVYHGPEGLRRIATRVHGLALTLARGLGKLGFKLPSAPFFDTLRVGCRDAAQAEAVLAAARARRINLRRLDETQLVVALDETVYPADLKDLLEVFGGGKAPAAVEELAREVDPTTSLGALRRKSGYLTHPTFARYRSEHEMLRYLRRLEGRDLSLTTSMIPLGSCTMKLNATSEMLPVTWPEIGGLHPFAPEDQTRGWARIFQDLERWLGEITGLPAVSLQPNAGSQGEYAGLLVIRAFHRARGQGHRDVCLIPVSAHGTNPASAAMAALRVVAVKCDERGNIDLADLEARAAEHADRLAALMVTYPSTHGVFEEGIKQVCEIVHRHGGQVYMDGANMNAQVGLCRPGDFGADVLHLNLHKTFCIPHGGGGPGMGPICCAAHLAPFLPGHPLRKTGGAQAIGPVSAAPWGSPSILPISWVYIALMGASGLERASQVAILNANWLARRLAGHYDVLYSGTQGFVAHEVILDCRGFKNTANITVEDIAKRLMDYSFHAPTVSFPVPGTLMIEPTESESLPELERFAEALIAIRAEIRAIEEGRSDKADNALKHAPHTSDVVCAASWTRPYSRETAAFPLPWVRERKFWPTVGRIDGVLGDRNLICTCPPVEAFSEPAPVPATAAAR